MNNKLFELNENLVFHHQNNIIVYILVCIQNKIRSIISFIFFVFLSVQSQSQLYSFVHS